MKADIALQRRCAKEALVHTWGGGGLDHGVPDTLRHSTCIGFRGDSLLVVVNASTFTEPRQAI